MLEDFIKANNLQARLLSCKPKGLLIKCSLFLSEGLEVLAICLAKDRVSEKKLNAALGTTGLKHVQSGLVEETTGYLAEYLPPISVYGVKAVLDKKAAKAGRLVCLVGEEKTLEITPKEILEANEGAIEAGITI